MFTVSVGEEEIELESRAKAIEEAKLQSSENGGRVLVTDDSGREHMSYRNGELEVYEYETRPQHRSRQS